MAPSGPVALRATLANFNFIFKKLTFVNFLKKSPKLARRMSFFLRANFGDFLMSLWRLKF